MYVIEYNSSLIDSGRGGLDNKTPSKERCYKRDMVCYAKS